MTKLLHTLELPGVGSFTFRYEYIPDTPPEEGDRFLNLLPVNNHLIVAFLTMFPSKFNPSPFSHMWTFPQPGKVNSFGGEKHASLIYNIASDIYLWDPTISIQANTRAVLLKALFPNNTVLNSNGEITEFDVALAAGKTYHVTEYAKLGFKDPAKLRVRRWVDNDKPGILNTQLSFNPILPHASVERMEITTTHRITAKQPIHCLPPSIDVMYRRLRTHTIM